MSLKRNLKTYLIAAVLLLMGGLAVGTVATASQPSSYLGIRKYWNMPNNMSWEEREKLINGLTLVFEIDYYNLDEDGNHREDKPITETVYMKYNEKTGEWFIQKKFPGMIEVVEVRELTGGGKQGDEVIPGIEKLGEYLLTGTKEDWVEERTTYKCGENISISWGYSDILILEKKDIADDKEYTYNITNDKESETGTAYEKTVTLSKEHPRKVIQVLGAKDSGTVNYTVNEVGGGKVTFKVSDSDIPRSVIENNGVYMPGGSEITIHGPGNKEDDITYYFDIFEEDEEGYKSYVKSDFTVKSGETGKVKAYWDGKYKVQLTKMEKVEPPEPVELLRQASEPTEKETTPINSDSLEPKDTTDVEDKVSSNEEITLPDTTETPATEPSEEEKKETLPEQGAETTEIKDGTVPLTNGEPADGTNGDVDSEENAGNEESPADNPNAPDDGDEGDTSPGDDATLDDSEEPSEDGDGSEETDEGIMPLDADSDEISDISNVDFTVDYSFEKTGVSVENIDIVNSDYAEVTVSAVSNGEGTGEASWSYKVFCDDTEIGTISVGEEKSLAAALAEVGLGEAIDGEYSLQPAGGCTITYFNPGVRFTNTYKIPAYGAYNVVHEYYADEAMTKLDGRSIITIQQDELDKEVKYDPDGGEGSANIKEVTEPTIYYDKNSKEIKNTYQYKFVVDAYGVESESESPNPDSDKDREENGADSLRSADETSDDESSDDGTSKTTEWKPISSYVEKPASDEEGKDNKFAKVNKEGNEIVILKYVRTTDDPKEDPKDPPKDPETPPDLPDPNDPDSPPTVTITDDDVPRTYVRVWDPKKEEWVYLPEDEVPLAGRTSPTTADGMAPVFWMFMTGLSVAGVGAFHYSKKKKEE